MKVVDGTVYCFVYPLNDTSRTDMNQVNQPLIAVSINNYFRTSWNLVKIPVNLFTELRSLVAEGYVVVIIIHVATISTN